ncbi:Thioredoxin-like fold,Peroxiredoxin, AhpC-type,Alkyl hydroperoxide reductase subunit C/ Thiol [Cinara cedri]|uniref:1-Cys peroxiredoxin n=1 Tax=Cinara cedri TaxID=506608 RepID=A0A5E4N4J1_9HEMI|nr:Thioredoxin-like fold,Peroxiredoxin, AhpC-type,Alkyl hydroperoxide reductase subunit C/ Thiol [Cinara cedri]
MRLNSVVPDFSGPSTKGPIDFYNWLGDSWCVLFAHPADFTPVCTTELGKMAVLVDEFTKRNTKVLGLSCDKLESHVNWINDIKSYCVDIEGEFPFPIISDSSRELAIKLDMLAEEDKNNPDTAMTIRSLYIIGPDKKVKLMMVYPTSTGRNIQEVLRCIDSLQLCDKKKIVATPVNWVPGEKVMILPSVDDKDLNALFPNGHEKCSMPSSINYLRMTSDY